MAHSTLPRVTAGVPRRGERDLSQPPMPLSHTEGTQRNEGWTPSTTMTMPETAACSLPRLKLQKNQALWLEPLKARGIEPFEDIYSWKRRIQ